MAVKHQSLCNHLTSSFSTLPLWLRVRTWNHHFQFRKGSEVDRIVSIPDKLISDILSVITSRYNLCKCWLRYTIYLVKPVKALLSSFFFVLSYVAQHRVDATSTDKVREEKENEWKNEINVNRPHDREVSVNLFFFNSLNYFSHHFFHLKHLLHSQNNITITNQCWILLYVITCSSLFCTQL